MKVTRRIFILSALAALAAAPLFAQSGDTVRLYIESTASNPAHITFFRDNFTQEAAAAGYVVANSPAAADYTLRLAVRQNTVLYDDGVEEPAPPDEKQYLLRIALLRSSDNVEIITLSYPFTELYEMYNFNHYLFNQAMANVPASRAAPPTEIEIIREVPVPVEVEVMVIRQVPVPVEVEVVREVQVPVEVVREVEVIREVQVPFPVEVEVVREVQVPFPVEVEVVREVQVPVEVEVVREVRVPVEVEVVRQVPVPVEVEVEVVREVEREVVVEREVEVLIEESDLWRNKLLYFRASVDFPFSYFQIKPYGLLPGYYIYSGTEDNPGRTSRVDDSIIIVPGATLGLEVQFLPWMSAELDVLLRIADAIDYSLIPGVALQLKFPVKPTRYFMLEPYITGSWSTNMAAHSTTPYWEAGAGLQFAVKGGDSGAWFLDVNYKHTINEVVTTNVLSREMTNPPELLWNRFVIGVGIGYKLGFIDRLN